MKSVRFWQKPSRTSRSICPRSTRFMMIVIFSNLVYTIHIPSYRHPRNIQTDVTRLGALSTGYKFGSVPAFLLVAVKEYIQDDLQLDDQSLIVG